MPNIVSTVPVILIDGLLASGSSVISSYVGRSYTFFVVNGNQYLRDLGKATRMVQAQEGTLQHELELLDFYQHIADNNTSVHDQMYSFLTSKVSIAKQPTIVHCTGYASYAFAKQVPVKYIFWLHATLDDRVNRLLTAHGITASEEEKKLIKEKLTVIDNLWESQLKKHMGINLRELESDNDRTIDTSNLSTEQAFQKLATIDSFVDTYNALASLLPEYAHEWRRWQCLNCKLVLETRDIVTQCPRCGNNDPNRFRDAD